MFLVVSIVLPFAAEFLGGIVFYNPGPFQPDYATTQRYRDWAFRWSFMYVKVTMPESVAHPFDYMHVGTVWSFLPDYWSLYVTTPIRSIALLSVFSLQMVLIPVGFITFRRASKAWGVVPFFLGAISLSVLYYPVSQLFWGTLSFGFWLSIVVTLFVSIALARTKKWI